MTIYNRPDNSVFASGAKQEETGTFPDIERGWGVTESTNFIPPLEYFNAVQNRTDKAIAYLMQRGVAEWSAEMEYPKQAITIKDGQVFFAKQQNTNKNPLSNPEIWVNSFAQKANVSDVYSKQEIDEIIGSSVKGSIQNYKNWYHERTLSRIGGYSGNVIQSVCIDDSEKNIFTLHRGRDDNDMYINRLNYKNCTTTVKSNAFMACKNKVGHQGLALQKTNEDGVVLWASAGSAFVEQGRKAVRFKFREDTLEPVCEEFKLFDDKFRSSGSATPCVSYDNRFLIVRGYSDPDRFSVIRVFKLEDLKSGGDYSQDYLYEFKIDGISRNEDFPMQGMACDGDFIYVQLGGGKMAINKALYIYTLEGRLVDHSLNITAGKEDAQNTGSGVDWESEGVTFAKNERGILSLYILIMSGDTGERTARLYSNNQRYISLTSLDINTPALLLNATHDIGIASKQQLTVSELDENNSSLSPVFTAKNGRISIRSTNQDSELRLNHVSTETRNYSEFRSNKELSLGGGFNFYGNNDPNSGKIYFYTGGNESLTFGIDGTEQNFYFGKHNEADIGKSSNYFSNAFVRRIATHKGGFVGFSEDGGEEGVFATLKKERFALNSDGKEMRLNAWTGDGRNLVEFRVDKVLSGGAGFNAYGATDSGAGKFVIYTGGANSRDLSINSNELYLTFAKDGEATLGTSKNRFSEIFAVNGSVQTSDERLKTKIKDIDNEVLDAWEDVNIVTFKWIDMLEKKGKNARTHIGILAQAIERAFKKHKLNAFDFGLLCYDEWDAEDEELDSDGSVIKEEVKAGSRYGIRAEQCLFLEAQCNRRKLANLEARLAKLENNL